MNAHPSRSSTRRFHVPAWRRTSIVAAVTTVVALVAVAPGSRARAAAAPSGPTVVGVPATASPAAVPIAFGVQGAAEVRTGIRGTVSIIGRFDGLLDPATNTFSGAFTLRPTVARVRVLGLVDADADTDWFFTEPVTGAWHDGALSLRAAARIHHERIVAFGHTIAGGPTCATNRSSVMELSSDPATPVSGPFAGATLHTARSGFAISALSGCGWLDGILSAVAAGTGNQATLTLTPLPAG